jgi:hypothetical protein
MKRCGEFRELRMKISLILATHLFVIIGIAFARASIAGEAMGATGASEI